MGKNVTADNGMQCRHRSR